MTEETDISNLNEEEKPGRYPTGAILILFFDIFCCYVSGANRSLPMLLLDIGGYTQDDGIEIYHYSMSITAIVPMFAAIVADSWTGKFPVLVIGCAITAVGLGLLTVSAVPYLKVPIHSYIWSGVILRSIGWGCINTTMAPIGADQFELPRQKIYLSQFFSWNHMIVNICLIIGVFVTTMIRSDIHCLEATHCYSLAFLIPTICMIFLFFSFIITKKCFKLYNPLKSTVIISVVSCILTAIINRRKQQGDNVPRAHWLYYAKEKYGDVFVEEVREILGVMMMCLPTILVWSVYMQYETRWIYQATKLDLRLGTSLMKPEHIILIDSVMVVLLIPILVLVIYPFMERFNIKRPLVKTLIGSLFVALGFITSGVLELLLENRMPPQLKPGRGQIRLYNGLQCNCSFEDLPGHKSVELEGLGYYEDTDVKVSGKQEHVVHYTPDKTCAGKILSHVFQIEVQEEVAIGYYLSDGSNSFSYRDVVNRSENGEPYFRVLADNLTDPIVIKNRRYTVLESTLCNNDIKQIKPGIYDVYIAGKKVKSDYEILMGGHYIFLVKKIGEQFKLKIHLIKETNYYSVFLQMPQLLLLSIGEIMFVLQMNEFVYGETPASLTSLTWAFNELMEGIGNLITVMFTRIENLRLSSQIFIYSGTLLLDCLIFGLLIRRYKYINPIWA